MRGVNLAAALALALALAFPVVAQPYQDEPELTLEERIQIETELRVWNNYQRRIAPLVAASGHPRDLAFAVFLQADANPVQTGAGPSGDALPSVPVAADPAVARWLSAALQGGDVVALALSLYQADPALRAQALSRWIAAEPDNAAPLLFHGAPSDWLERAAGTRRFDLHMYEQVRWMQAALIRHPLTASERASLGIEADVPDEEHAAITAMSLFAAMAAPGFDGLFEACGVQSGRPSSQARPSCVHLAEVLAHHSDNNLARSVGVGLLEQLAATPQARAQAAALRRQLDWQMYEWQRISAAQPREGMPQFARLLRAPGITSEPVLVERILREAGSPLAPPADWQSPYRHR